VDVTCNTQFPYAEFDQLKERPELRSAPSGIRMQLEFSPSRPEFFSWETRRALALVIDDRLTRTLSAGLSSSPARLSSDDQRMESADRIRMARSLLHGAKSEFEPLTLAYYDYYPNKIVAECVLASWRQHLGIRCRAVRMPFSSPADTRADVRLQLRFPKYKHVLARREAEIACLLQYCLRDAWASDALGSLNEIIKSEHPDQMAFDEFECALSKGYCAVPLYELKSVYLISEAVQGFQYPHDAQFSYLDLRSG
jgi:hypothetical protein